MSSQHPGNPSYGARHPVPEPELEARVRALESLLAERGLISSDMIDRVVSAYENDIGPMIGARVVARAWTDVAFKERLLQDATKACAELGIGGMQGEHMVCVENTSQVHNVVCCTLCSCYPWPVLGLPPSWYKHPAYRARLVSDPRRTLREDFDLEIPENAEVRIWDSSAEIRYFVLPERPANSDQMSEEDLASLVIRDAMIGVAKAQTPEPARRRERT